MTRKKKERKKTNKAQKRNTPITEIHEETVREKQKKSCTTIKHYL